jgi:hypothetical protein
MDSELIVNFWNCVKDYLDKKQIEIAAEKYVDMIADYGVDDLVLKDCLGSDDNLDAAIEYYLDDEEDWDE